MYFQKNWSSPEKCKCQGVWFIKVLSGSEDHITKFEEQHLSVGKDWPVPIISDKAVSGGWSEYLNVTTPMNINTSKNENQLQKQLKMKCIYKKTGLFQSKVDEAE